MERQKEKISVEAMLQAQAMMMKNQRAREKANDMALLERGVLNSVEYIFRALAPSPKSAVSTSLSLCTYFAVESAKGSDVAPEELKKLWLGECEKCYDAKVIELAKKWAAEDAPAGAEVEGIAAKILDAVPEGAKILSITQIDKETGATSIPDVTIKVEGETAVVPEDPLAKSSEELKADAPAEMIPSGVA